MGGGGGGGLQNEKIAGLTLFAPIRLFDSVRDWSLITGRGEEGQVKYYSYEKGGGAEKVLETEQILG